MHKLTVYIPESHLELVKEAIFNTGAGFYGAYDRCCWEILGKSQFRPLAGSNSFIGKKGIVEEIPEYRVEILCTDDLVPAVSAAIRSSHPYEEPAFDFVHIVDH